MGTKKLPWPVAKVREDGTPAIWLNFSTWFCIKDGLVNKYIYERESEGRRLARNAIRDLVGPHPEKVLKELKSWNFLDSTAGAFSTASEVLNLYRIGYTANPSAADLQITPDALVALGDKLQKREFDKTMAELCPLPLKEAA